MPEFGEVDLVVIDGPGLPGATGASRPLVAAWADSWPGEVSVLAGLVADAIRERAVLAPGRSGCGTGRMCCAHIHPAAEAGARVVLLDEAVVRASVRAKLDWPWTGTRLGGEVAATLAFDNMAGLPWSVAHLRRSGDQLQWTRRGADVAESWTFPEAANDGRFAVEVDEGSGFEGRFAVAVPEATLPGGATATRVAEIGADGRTGPWVSIGPGTP
ncbi:MAG: hypothetical protein KKC43_00605 [Alphaproteobacteria bacterium]|nr:hypothetical protein [Alphaproteobacteria bacterium]